MDDDGDADDHTPLLASSYIQRQALVRGGQGYFTTQSNRLNDRLGSTWQQRSRDSSRSSRLRRSGELATNPSRDATDYDVNNPPSVPSSPKFGATLGVHDSLFTDSARNSGDILIDIDAPTQSRLPSSPTGATGPGSLKRRVTLNAAEEDVCFPQDILSEIAEEEDERRSRTEVDIDQEGIRPRRRRRKQWPDLNILDEWSREEKEERAFGADLRTRKVHEPLYVEGRLRPRNTDWHRELEDAPYRFTYFNEEFESTLHSQTISELLQPGQTFHHLFIPEPPLLEDSESETDEEDMSKTLQSYELDRKVSAGGGSHPPSVFRSELPRPEPLSKQSTTNNSSDPPTGMGTPLAPSPSPPASGGKQKIYGPRPVFWLDVLCPTETEMRVLSKTFGIHPLTAEDIMMQESREKVELFKNYYFVTYLSLEQDVNSEDHMEPVNLYIIVFREGILTFHFSQTPHPANVRRRIRQLSDYLFLSTDWISYALIDDVTDAYVPLVQRIEEEVDRIDQSILDMHNHDEPSDAMRTIRNKLGQIMSDRDDATTEKEPADSARDHKDMLRHVGHWRKKVMGMYRLLGTKADVIKGFAKRCNEQWEVAPRSEIGLYLGDIQDHIVTMTGNLSHYEK
jgi:magnesium transporter